MTDPVFNSQPASAKGWIKLAAGVLFLAAAVWFGREFGRKLPALERIVDANAFAGGAIFIGTMILFTSVFVPDTVFAILSGVLFGLFWGTVLVSIGSVLTSAIDFALSRLLLQKLVRRWLDRNQRMAAIERALNREGFRFQFLVRLSPLSPVAVSYALGVTNTSWPVFLAASFGVVPGLFVEVYFGYMAKHVAKISGKVSDVSWTHPVVTVAGLLLCVALMIYIMQVTRKALAEGSRNCTSPGT